MNLGTHKFIKGRRPAGAGAIGDDLFFHGAKKATSDPQGLFVSASVEERFFRNPYVAELRRAPQKSFDVRGIPRCRV